MKLKLEELNRNNRLVIFLLLACFGVLLFTRQVPAQSDKNSEFIKTRGIELVNQNGVQVGGFTVNNKDGSGNFWMKDGTGNVRAAMAIQGDGTPVLILISPNGHQAVVTPH